MILTSPSAQNSYELCPVITQLDAVREGDGKLNMTNRELKLDMQTVKMLQKTAGRGGGGETFLEA